MSLQYRARRTLVYVNDLPGAIRFYQETLGFTPTVGLEGRNQEFATGGLPLVLHDALQEPRVTGVVPSFQVDDIQAVAAHLKARGVRTLVDVMEVPHGWIYFCRDNEGNVIQIYQGK